MSNRLSAAIESTTSKFVQPAMGHAAKLMKLPLANGFRWAPLFKIHARIAQQFFLVDPLNVRPWWRMPKTVGNLIEARDVASFLLKDVVVSAQEPAIRRMVYQVIGTNYPTLNHCPTEKSRWKKS